MKFKVGDKVQTNNSDVGTGVIVECLYDNRFKIELHKPFYGTNTYPYSVPLRKVQRHESELTLLP